MSTAEFSVVVDLLRRVPQPQPPPGLIAATPADLDALHEALGFAVPDELGRWLRVCNGYLAGPGGLLGTGTSESFLDISSVLRLHAAWVRRAWIPVAGDGHGNYYVIDASRSHLPGDGVFFVDVESDPDELAYVVASALEPFLRQLLASELGEARWPFDEAHVMASDPEIGEVHPRSLLPWLT